MDVILFGPPGAGKGTQANLLADSRKTLHISTGDIMRAERGSGSELGKKFDAYMSAGKLVPDALVLELIEKRLRQPDASTGAIFDGYPRTVPQAEALESLLARLGRRIERVVSLEVPLEDIVGRVIGRRVCVDCGQTYHVRYNPPPQSGKCVSCGGNRIEQRTDDTEEVVQKRYEEYKSKTEPVLSYYRERGLVVSVDGVGNLDDVSKRIEAAIGVNGS